MAYHTDWLSQRSAGVTFLRDWEKLQVLKSSQSCKIGTM